MSRPTDYVFLHGGGQGSWVWEGVIAALHTQTGGAFGRALALDVPGCGTKRGRDTAGLGPDEVAAELLADIEAAGFSDALLVGHSQAGTILPRMLERRPGLFRRAVYVSCVGPLPGQTVLGFRATMPRRPDEPVWAKPGEAYTRDVYRRLFCNDMSPAEAEAFLDHLGADGWPARTMEVSDWPYAHLGEPPGTYVLCLQDATLLPDWQEIFAERFKVERRVSIDAGHQVMNTRPHALAEVLRLEAELK
jgi:pimeloyl-ACP methyl ester carboxylesterase